MEMTSLENNDKLDGKHQRDLIFVCILFKINGLVYVSIYVYKINAQR